MKTIIILVSIILAGLNFGCIYVDIIDGTYWIIPLNFSAAVLSTISAYVNMVEMDI